MTDAYDSAANRHATLTLRLILAELTGDDDARDTVVEEINDCPDCWRAIATRAVFEAAACMWLHFGDERAIAEIQAELSGTLDARP
jgi:hypothetical protein